MSPVDPKKVRRIAELARLRFTSEQEAAYGEELAKILDYVAVLEELPEAAQTGTIETQSTPERDDAVRDPDSPDSTLANAPDRHGSFFRVPVVIHEDS